MAQTLVVLTVLIVGAFYGLGRALEDNVIEYVLRIILFCGINVILAVGLNLINGTTGQFSIGHAGFMAVGAYATAFTVMHLGGALFPGQTELGAALRSRWCSCLRCCWARSPRRWRACWSACPACACAATTWPSSRSASARSSASSSTTRALRRRHRLLRRTPAGLPIYTNFFWVSSVGLLVIVLIGNLTFSSYGRALEAIRDDEIAAEAMGIPTTRFKVLAFVDERGGGRHRGRPVRAHAEHAFGPTTSSSTSRST